MQQFVGTIAELILRLPADGLDSYAFVQGKACGRVGFIQWAAQARCAGLLTTRRVICRFAFRQDAFDPPRRLRQIAVAGSSEVHHFAP